jgi:hypothetical protein
MEGLDIDFLQVELLMSIRRLVEHLKPQIATMHLLYDLGLKYSHDKSSCTPSASAHASVSVLLSLASSLICLPAPALSNWHGY